MRFDFDLVFDPDDYLLFAGDALSDERSVADVQAMWRLLGLAPGARVLDVACGTGRHAWRLAQKGAVVTALDQSKSLLRVGRRSAREQGVEVEWLHGDMRHLPWAEVFDGVVCWGTSFGYFPDDENRAVLSGLARVLKPGGRLVLDLPNRDHLLPRLQTSSVVEREGALLVERHAYNPRTGRTENERLVVRGPVTRRGWYDLRLYTFPELHQLLRDVGLARVAVEDEAGAPYALASRRMVVSAQRPA